MNPERRRYARQACLLPIRFTALDPQPHRPLHIAKTKNVSEGGMKITAMAALEPHAIALVEVDLGSLNGRVKEDKLLAISKKRVLCDVVWRKLNLETGLFEAGLKFIPSSQREQFQSAVEKASELV